MIYTVTLNPAIDREYTVPALVLDDVLRASQVRVDPGGKGFNVSRMLRVLGEPSVALGFVGGKSGEWLSERLTQLGVETDFVWLDGETRTNTTVVTAGDGRHLKVNEAGLQVPAAAQDDLLTRVTGLVRPGDLWVLAGSLPPGVPTDFYGVLIELIHAKGGQVMLDTSGAALKRACADRPDWIKPNLDELAVLVGDWPQNEENEGDEGRLDKALSVLNEQGIGQCIISLGKDGALLVAEGQQWRLTPPKIVEKNPIGAGDAMVGGFVWGLKQELSPLDACRWGIACGSMAASRPGTDFGTKAEIEALMNKVVVV